MALTSQQCGDQALVSHPHCVSVKGQLCLCFMLSGPSPMERSLPGISDFMGEVRKLDSKAPARELFLPGVARVTSACWIGWTSPLVRPDVIG